MFGYRYSVYLTKSFVRVVTALLSHSNSLRPIPTIQIMVRNDFFTALPSNISALVIADYLALVDIVRLDSAFCGKDARNAFLALYHEDGCVLKIKQHSVITFTIPTFLWLASRSLSVQGISLHKTWTVSLTDKLIEYVKVCGNKIMFFHPSLDRGDTMSVVQFKSIVRKCPELTMLVGIPETFVTDHAMKVVRQSNPKLMCINVFQDKGSYSSGDLSALKMLVEGGLPTLQSVRIPLTEDLATTLLVIAQNCPILETVEVKSRSDLGLKLANGDGILNALSECKNLEKLVLPAQTVTDAGVRALSKCAALTVLMLTDNADITDEGFEILSKGCFQLVELRLRNLEARQGVPRFRTTQFNNLQKLALSSCTALRDDDIIHLASTCPKLTVVDLYMCVNLTDAAVCALSVHCPLLAQLNIVGLQFTDGTFAQLAQTSTRLTHLFCTPYEPFDARVGVTAAFTHLTELQHLAVERSNLLNDPDVVNTLLQHCTKLKTLESMFAEVCQEIMELMANASFQYYGDGIFER